MNTKSVPSLYRYCISRLSTLAVSTFVPALNVRSTTFPESTFLSLVRTNAPPLPGLTCWNSTTAQSWPSKLSTVPFFRSLVVATRHPVASMGIAERRTRVLSAVNSTVDGRAAAVAVARGPRFSAGEQRLTGNTDGRGPDHRCEGADDEPLRCGRVGAQLRVPAEALDRDDDGDRGRVGEQDRATDGEAFQQSDPRPAAQRGRRLAHSPVRVGVVGPAC